jgi:hypothetical protein
MGDVGVLHDKWIDEALCFDRPSVSGHGFDSIHGGVFFVIN